MLTMCHRHVIHLLQFLQEPDEVGSATFEDTEALQPKPKATKLALESRLFTPGACVSKQGMSRDLTCSPSSQEAVSLPDSQLERHLIKGCPRQGSEHREEWSWEDPADPGQQAQCTQLMCETEHIL